MKYHYTWHFCERCGHSNTGQRLASEFKPLQMAWLTPRAIFCCVLFTFFHLSNGWLLMFWLICLQKMTLAYSLEEGFCKLHLFSGSLGSPPTPHLLLPTGSVSGPVSTDRNLVPNSVTILCFLQDTVACFQQWGCVSGSNWSIAREVGPGKMVSRFQNSKALGSVVLCAGVFGKVSG